MSTSKLNEGQPVINFLGPADAKTATLDKPAESALNNPTAGGEASLARNGTVFNERFTPSALMFDVGDITLLLNKIMNIGKIVACVSTQMLLGVGSRYNNRDNQVIGGPLIMDVRTGYKHGQWCAAAIHQQMDFAATLGSIYRAFACRLASQRGGTGFGIQRLPFPFDVPLAMIELDHLPHDCRKYAIGLPFLKAIMQGRTAYPKPIPMHSLPLAACPQHIPDTIQHCPIIGSLATRLPILIYPWYQLPDTSPQWPWHMKIIDIIRFCSTILAHGVSVPDWSWPTQSERDTPLFSTPSLIYG
jgi:hypothetical protein